MGGGSSQRYALSSSTLLRPLSLPSSIMLEMFHPEAKSSYDAKALRLIQGIKEFKFSEDERSFPSELHPRWTLTEANIVNFSGERFVDLWGNPTARFFRRDSRIFGTDKISHDALVRLAEEIQSTARMRDIVSTNYVADALFEWIKQAIVLDGAETGFCDWFQRRAQLDVRDQTIWIPIANLEVAKSIVFGLAELRSISTKQIDEWQSQLLLRVDIDRQEEIHRWILALREQFQGKAAAVVHICAESTKAFQVALERAQVATSFLGMFSIGSLIPNTRCASRVAGMENVIQATYLTTAIDKPLTKTQVVLDLATVRPWRLGDDEIDELNSAGLKVVSALLASKKHTKFQESVLHALKLYSKAAFTADPVEKVVFVLSAMESLLLRNPSEPIQQNLSERIAIFVENELHKRKQVVKRVRAAYDMRSKYLHHGYERGDLDNTKQFLRTAWMFFTQVVANTDTFQTRDDFINAIDDFKLS